MYEFSVSAIFRMIGSSPPTLERMNVTPELKQNTFSVDESTTELIRRANNLDDAIYQHVRRVLVSQKEAWWKHFGALHFNSQRSIGNHT
jgi:hypothetical protein